MATIPASLEAQLDADWTGAGGAEPAYYSTEVFTYSNPPPMGEDFVWIVEKSLKTLSPRFNDLYANKTHTIDIIVNSGTTAARLKELSDEVERILNATAITGVHIQHIEERDLISPETTKNHLERVQVQMKTLLSASSTAYGAGATGDFDVLGDFTVAGDTELTGAFGFDTGEDVDIVLDEDNMASDDADALVTQQSIKAYVDAHNMIGSANAAWVPALCDGWGPLAAFEFDIFGDLNNVDATDGSVAYSLPIPCNKGGLKLYVAGTAVHLADADGANLVTNTFVFGQNGGTLDILDTDTSNKTTVARHEDTFTAIDCSAYELIKIRLECTNTNGGALEIRGVAVKCYYTT